MSTRVSVLGTLPLGVTTGGTGVSSVTAYAVLCGGTSSTGAFQSIAGVGTSGQVLTSNGAGALPTFQAAGGGGVTWANVTGSTQSMAVNTGYTINDSSSLVTLTLPATAAIGSILAVAGNSADGWKIAQNSGQTINFSAQSTTTGTSGYLASTNQYDCVELVCTVANTTFTVRSSVGNITVN